MRSAVDDYLGPLVHGVAHALLGVDGHDVGELARKMQILPNGSGKPVALIANTVKGKGVSFMEDDNNWHYRAPTADEVVKAHKELGLI